VFFGFVTNGDLNFLFFRYILLREMGIIMEHATERIFNKKPPRLANLGAAPFTATFIHELRKKFDPHHKPFQNQKNEHPQHLGEMKILLVLRTSFDVEKTLKW